MHKEGVLNKKMRVPNKRTLGLGAYRLLYIQTLSVSGQRINLLMSSTFKSVVAACLLVAPWIWAGEPDMVSDDSFRNMVQERYVAPYRAGNIDQWVKAFAPHAIALHSGQPMHRGRESIEQFGRMVASHFRLDEFAVTVTDIRRGDGWVYTAGEYVSNLISREDGTSLFGRQEGKFVLVWEQQDNGEWVVILDAGNPSESAGTE